MATKAEVAKALATRFGGTYNRRTDRPDIETDSITINVESRRRLATACGRLRGFRGPVYIAMTKDADLDEALAVTDGKTVGVMNNKGDVVRKSTRNHW